MDEGKIRKLLKVVSNIPTKDKIEFITLNRIKVDNIKLAKTLLFGLNDSFKKMRFFGIH